MATIEFQELSINVDGVLVGEFSGSADIEIDADGDACVMRIVLDALVLGSPDLILTPPKPDTAPERLLLWHLIETSLRDSRAEAFLDLEYDAAIAELGYGPMQHERL